MTDDEIARYQAEFRDEFFRVVYHMHTKGEVTSTSTAALFELYREQLKAAYTSGYEDHAAVCTGVSHSTRVEGVENQ